MSLKLTLAAVRGDYAKAFAAIEQPIARAVTQAIDETKNQMVREDRALIAAAGFSARWQNALRGERYPRSGVSINAAAFIHHKIRYADVFQEGAHIAGSPLLWLALPTTPPAIGGRKMTPRIYEQQIGQLHTIKVPGKKPMLAAYMRGRPGSRITLGKLRAGAALARLGVGRRRKSDTGRAGLVSVPLFVGLDSVTLRKRFDLRPVVARAQAQLGEKYARALR